MRTASSAQGAFRTAARRVAGRRAKNQGSRGLGVRAAILVVNGFDRHSATPFDVEEARRFPWIDLCLGRLARHTPMSSYEVLVWDNAALPEQSGVLERDSHVSVFRADDGKDVRHGRALDRLIRKVNEDIEYVVTLDTDAFPIRSGWLDNLLSRLEDGATLTGVWRDEMAPDITPYVHPSCLAVRRETLAELDVEFSRQGGGQDVGQRLTEAVLESGGSVSPLRRSNFRNAHFLLAGLYGDLVYHHGAGSRHASFWTSDDETGDEAARTTLRDAAFADLDALIGFLAGDLPADEARTRVPSVARLEAVRG